MVGDADVGGREEKDGRRTRMWLDAMAIESRRSRKEQQGTVDYFDASSVVPLDSVLSIRGDRSCLSLLSLDGEVRVGRHR